MKNEIKNLQKEVQSLRKEIVSRKESKVIHGKKSFTPTLITILVAIIGTSGTFLASILQKNTELEQKRMESEQALILKAIENGDLSQSRKNLEFFVQAGFIKDKEGRIAGLIADSSTIPVLQQVSGNFSFNYPNDGDTLLAAVFEVSGEFAGRKIPAAHKIWIMLYKEGILHPMEAPITVSGSGKWFGKFVTGLTGNLKIVACLADIEASEKLFAETQDGSFKSFRVENMPSGIQIVDFVRIFRPEIKPNQ